EAASELSRTALLRRGGTPRTPGGARPPRPLSLVRCRPEGWRPGQVQSVREGIRSAYGHQVLRGRDLGNGGADHRCGGAPRGPGRRSNLAFVDVAFLL